MGAIMKKLRDYCYQFTNEDDEYCGEYIFVECSSREEAEKSIRELEWENRVEFVYECSVEKAEEIGYDTY